MSGHQRCTQLNSISVGKEITGIPSRPTGILQHLEVFTYYLKLKEKGHFFFIKSNPLTRRLEVTRAETGNYWVFFLALCIVFYVFYVFYVFCVCLFCII